MFSSLEKCSKSQQKQTLAVAFLATVLSASGGLKAQEKRPSSDPKPPPVGVRDPWKLPVVPGTPWELPGGFRPLPVPEEKSLHVKQGQEEQRELLQQQIENEQFYYLQQLIDQTPSFQQKRRSSGSQFQLEQFALRQHEALRAELRKVRAQLRSRLDAAGDRMLSRQHQFHLDQELQRSDQELENLSDQLNELLEEDTLQGVLQQTLLETLLRKIAPGKQDALQQSPEEQKSNTSGEDQSQESPPQGTVITPFPAHEKGNAEKVTPVKPEFKSDLSLEKKKLPGLKKEKNSESIKGPRSSSAKIQGKTPIKREEPRKITFVRKSKKEIQQLPEMNPQQERTLKGYMRRSGFENVHFLAQIREGRDSKKKLYMYEAKHPRTGEVRQFLVSREGKNIRVHDFRVNPNSSLTSSAGISAGGALKGGSPGKSPDASAGLSGSYRASLYETEKRSLSIQPDGSAKGWRRRHSVGEWGGLFTLGGKKGSKKSIHAEGNIGGPGGRVSYYTLSAPEYKKFQKQWVQSERIYSAGINPGVGAAAGKGKKSKPGFRLFDFGFQGIIHVLKKVSVENKKGEK